MINYIFDGEYMWGIHCSEIEYSYKIFDEKCENYRYFDAHAKK
jgi:hypothetical protein